MLRLRTLLFTLFVPGTVLALVPLGLLAGGVGPALQLGAARWVGLLPLGSGLVVILRCFAEFIRRGHGTLRALAPAKKVRFANRGGIPCNAGGWLAGS